MSFAIGQRVVLTKHGERTYATVVGDGSLPESIMLDVEGRYINPQEHWRANVKPALAARDMVIGDLLNLDMLKEVFEVEFIGTLWTDGDSGPMTPYVCRCSFGDGLKLIKIFTINQRPNYHVVRVDSGWAESSWSDGENVGDHIDDVLTAIEDECGNARCGYSGNSLRWPREERLADCQCEECDDEGISVWPEIDADIGFSWGEVDWSWLMKKIGLPA